jgi:U3 small nucleolar RNA-associated protein 13
MANKAPYKTTFEPEHTIQPIYTGGSVALDLSGRILATTLGEDALLTDLNTGKQLAKIEGVCNWKTINWHPELLLIYPRMES